MLRMHLLARDLHDDTGHENLIGIPEVLISSGFPQSFEFSPA